MNEAAVSLSPGRPLAPMQRGLWMSQRLHPDAPVQNMALLTHVEGSVDADRLVAAFDRVVDEVDVLRTRFIEDRGTPLVRLDATRQEPTVLSMTKAEAEDWARARVRVPIDTTVRGYDSAVIEHPDGTTSWYLSLHHTITDATSSAMIFAATAAAYHGEPFEAPSYYAWSRRFDGEQADTEAETAPAVTRQRQAADFWRQRPSAPKIDRLYQPVRDPEPAADRLPVVMSESLVAALDERLAADYRMLSPDLAWTALLMTVTAAYLNQVAGAEAFSLGLPVHNRGDAEARSLIGPIMEVFPVDVAIEQGATFRSLHREIGRSILRTLGQAAPGTAPPPDYAAVVNVIPRAAVGSFGSLETSTQWIHSGAIDSNHLLRVQLSAYRGPNPDSEADQPTMALDLNHGGADADQRGRAPGHLVRIVEAMVDDPDRSIAVRLPDGDELAAIRAWERADDFDGETIDVVSGLEAALARRETVALRDGEQTWTGSELWQRVQAVAEHLRADGVEPGTRVGIELARSSDAVIAILAVLVAGGSFVPLDVALPARRRRALSTRADCHLVLSALPDPEERPAQPEVTEPVAPGPAVRPAPGQEAYLLFTSGSTGRPKGVPITHEGLARYLRFAVESYVDPRGPAPVVPLFSALSFDLTITSLFLPLLTGGEQVIIRADGPAGLAAIAADSTLNWCKATPSHLEVLARLVPADHRLRTLVVGGEAFGSGLARRLLELSPDLSIFNEYGPTEAVVGCMIHRVDRAQVERTQEVPIGVPAPGVELRVVGPDLERVPLGAAGELCISHVGVTAGYLLDSAADNDGDPFVELDGVRFYRSGDLVRLVDPETLVYLGRIDEQVKVGGIRLEPTEVEEAIASHPAISRAAVRLWSPTRREPDRHCTTCGLPSNVPGVVFDLDGVCSTCHDYERVAPQTTDWFRTPDDLRAKRDEARRNRRGRYDCLHLLSGGKDSTYALYQLVEAGFEPYVLTLDNGFISEGAKENVRRSIADLGIDHEFATSASMNAVFRDSLERHSNVCHGCYKTIYTLATTRADELGIPMIVTGLSRGQLFETRLIPQQFASGRFDPDAIDRAVVEARKTYHRLDDGPNRLLDTKVFASDDVFDRIEYLDFYRYVDVELAEMLDYLGTKAPWVRPSDTGRSTNCLVNAAGIHTHLTEQGYHNYAIPYAWDVRLGHKTRDEAIEELDDQLDAVEVDQMLQTIGYTPKPVEVLTAWLEPLPGEASPNPAELRSFLAEILPTHGIPAAFVTVDEIPMTTNGKLDAAALPAPERIHRTSTGIQVAAESELEATVIRIWERLLRLEPIGAEDDFFALGGDSLGALEMIVAVGDDLGRALGDELAFGHTTPRALAAAIELTTGSLGESGDALDVTTTAGARPPLGPSPWSAVNAPPLSPGEQAILFDQSLAPASIKYNVGRLYVVDGPLDTVALSIALRSLIEVNIPLSWTYGRTRRRLDPADAMDISIGTVPVARDRLDEHFGPMHRAPFDLENGPLLRVAVEPTDDGGTAVLLACHHVSGDAGSFDRLWTQLDDALNGRPIAEPPIDYPSFTQWQQSQLTADDTRHWRLDPGAPAAAGLLLGNGAADESDGFRTRVASISAAQLKRRAGTSGFALATTAVMATLRRYTAGDAVSLGLISSSRNHPAAEPLFGYFLNTLPLDLDCPLDEQLGSLTDRVASAIAANLAHRSYPYSRIVADRRADGVAPAASNVLLAYDELSTTTLQGRVVEQKVLSNGSAVTDLTLFVELRDEQVDLSLEYRGSLLGQAEADQLLADVDAMLAAVGNDESTAVGGVDLPSVSDSILFGDELEAPPHVLDLIAANAERVGIEEAVVCGDDAISWTELDRLSAGLAGRLAASGVGRGDRVVVEMPRSVDLAVAILGVLRAGAAYVPVDPSYPAERRALIIERADPALTLIASTDARRAGADERRLVVDRAELLDQGTTGSRPAVDGDDVAYVIFTSGSTGRPRGVPVTHRQLAASTMARAGIYEQEAGRFLVVSSLAFDSSIAGLFWALVDGGTVVFPTDDEVHDPDRLIALFAEQGISNTLMVPSLYQALLARADGNVRWPEQIIVAGEACPPTLVAAHFRRRPEVALTNEYGPTEATVWASAHHCLPGDDPVPIGGAIPGAWLAVVDEAGGHRPQGVPGELLIGGAGVVDGYFRDEQRTSERFATEENGRYFRTGDRALIRDGVVHFLGRIDDQLNVGGVRAEPEDIERVLNAESTVGAAVVTAIDPRSLDDLASTTDKALVAAAMREAANDADPTQRLIRGLRTMDSTRLRLVAFVEPANNSVAIDTEAVRSHAADHLPPLLRPSLITTIASLPRTPNGKVDRQAALSLPITTPLPAAVDGVADGIDERVAALFAEVLQLPTLGPDESFFDAGGHSLLAMDLLLRLEKEVAVEVTVSTLYERPTPRAVADFVRGLGPTRAQNRFLVPIQPNGTRHPIFGIHVLGPNAEFYRPLAERLGPDQPIWGLGLPTRTPDTSGPTEVEAVANRYADELEACAPTGPVTLAAVSLGSVVAFELAHQLRARGREVALLALFDAAGPGATDLTLTRGERLRVHGRELVSDPADYIKRRSVRVRARLERQAEIASLKARERLRLPVPTELKVRAFVEANWAAQGAYDFKPYPGPIVIYKAGDDPFTRQLAAAGMGWADIAAGSFKVTVVPGEHLSMLDEPHVETLALELEADHERAMATAAMLSDRPARVTRDEMEATLIEALGAGRIGLDLARALERLGELEPEAAELVRRCDGVTTGLASRAREQAAAANTALAAAGVSSRVQPVPARLAHCTFGIQIDIDDGADRPGSLTTALSALAPLGYRPQQRIEPDAVWRLVDNADSLPLIHHDATIRLDLRWGSKADGALPDRSLTGLSTDDEPDLGVFLGTPVSIVADILAVAEPTSGELVTDLGCGDGRVLIEAAKHHGLRGRGVENDPRLVMLARSNVDANGLDDLIEITEADASTIDLGETDIAFAFLPPRVIASILPDVLGRLAPGARLIAHEQLDVDWPVAPDRSVLIVGDHLTVAHLWTSSR